MPELLLFIGLQGAGKTTFYHHYFATTHAHISKDLWPNVKNKDARQQQLIAEAFERGQSVVVDNTSLTATIRAPILQQAKAAGARVYAYAFEADLAACLERNAGREGRARVPELAIYAAIKRLEPPTMDEGFDAIFEVRLNDSPNTFDVTQRES